eukprot:3187392-Pleurochrysis_carterae.AAC.3
MMHECACIRMLAYHVVFNTPSRSGVICLIARYAAKRHKSAIICHSRPIGRRDKGLRAPTATPTVLSVPASMSYVRQ